MLEIHPPSCPFLSLILFLPFRLRRAIQSEGGRCEVVEFNRKKKKNQRTMHLLDCFVLRGKEGVFREWRRKIREQRD